MCPGVGAFLNAEQFGLNQIGRDGGAVDGHERLIGALAALMHTACNHLLANAGLAQQQHRDLALGGLVDGFADLFVGARLADAVVLTFLLIQVVLQRTQPRLQVVKLLDNGVFPEVAFELLRVIPFLRRLADDQAALIAAAAAADFAEDDFAAHERGAVGTGIAQQRPAGRLMHQPQFRLANLDLERVYPLQLAVEVALLVVKINLDWLDLDHALE